MAVVNVEGKRITLPDDVVRAGDKAIRAVLAANGFPAIENADIQVVGGESGAPAIVNVSPRSTGKGVADSIADPITAVYGEHAHFIKALIKAPECVNPAILMAAQALRAESEGDGEFINRKKRSGELERAIHDGMREGKALHKAMQLLGHVVPCSSKQVPPGF